MAHEKTVEEAAYERASAICRRFGAAEVKLSHGAPSFHVRGKHFAMFSRGGYGEVGPGLWIKCTFEEQRELVAREPERYFVPKYVGVKGWVAVRLDPKLGLAGPNDADLAILIENGWAAVVPKSLANAAPQKPPTKSALKLAQTDPKVAASALALLCKLASELADVESEVDVRDATFRVRKKPFLYFLNNHHGDGIISACVRTDLTEITALIKRDPKRFYLPAYIGKHGWLGVRLDLPRTDTKDLRARVNASYDRAASKKTATANAAPGLAKKKRRLKG
jgi:hypothetical protein